MHLTSKFGLKQIHFCSLNEVNWIVSSPSILVHTYYILEACRIYAARLNPMIKQKNLRQARTQEGGVHAGKRLDQDWSWNAVCFAL